MIVLGIETSCDETAVAVVDDRRQIMSNLVLSQLDEHRVFGGVVPEIAARAHLDHLDRLIEAALDEAGIGFSDLDGVAATCGPGLIGGVMVGMMAGKAIAAARKLPFIAVNHLEAHLLTARLADNVSYPYLVLLVSGGHTQLLVAEALGKYHVLGQTIDDAAGECFDKSAKMMGLPYPGGPHLEQAATRCPNGDEAIDRFDLPRPLAGRPGCDFSFSGLKTAVRAHIDKLPEGPLQMQDIAPLAYSFQHAVADVLADRCGNAIALFRDRYAHDMGRRPLVVCGGVAANKVIRARLAALAEEYKMSFSAPPGVLCSDNGAMIAWTGIEKLKAGKADLLDFAARPRWPLDDNAGQGKAAGHGGIKERTNG